MPNIPLPRRGASVYRSLDLDEGAAEVVKSTKGCLLALYVTNTATTTRWVKLYDRATATVGTHTPLMTIGVPGNASDDILAALGAGGVGIQFSTGICIGCSTGFADNDTGAPGTNDVVMNAVYI